MRTTAQQIDVRVRISHPRGAGPRRIEIAVTDAGSGIDFLTIEMDPEQFADLMSGAMISATATVGGLDKVGTKQEVTRVSMGRGQGEYGNDVPARVETKATEMEADGWTVERRRSNQGWELIGRKWAPA